MENIRNKLRITLVFMFALRGHHMYNHIRILVQGTLSNLASFFIGETDVVYYVMYMC